MLPYIIIVLHYSPLFIPFLVLCDVVYGVLCCYVLSSPPLYSPLLSSTLLYSNDVCCIELWAGLISTCASPYDIALQAIEDAAYMCKRYVQYLHAIHSNDYLIWFYSHHINVIVIFVL